jgi:hypothetical protein
LLWLLSSSKREKERESPRSGALRL